MQAIQALKETQPEASESLMGQLSKLGRSLSSYEDYCQSTEQPPQLKRAHRQVQDVMHLLFPGSFSFRGKPLVSSSSESQISMSSTAYVESFQLGQHTVPRLFAGFWQLSSPAWGSGTAEKQEAALTTLVEHGITAADMADHYVSSREMKSMLKQFAIVLTSGQGDAELIYGDFRAKLSPDIRPKIFAATKWCVFHPIKVPMTRDYVLDAVRERVGRLGGIVQLLQFHWYDVSCDTTDLQP